MFSEQIGDARDPAGVLVHRLNCFKTKNFFFAAARNGDFDALVAVLDPDVVVRSDGGNLPAGAAAILHGAAAVAAQALAYARLAPFVRPAIVNGAAGVVVAPGGKPFSVMAFTIRHNRIVTIDALSDQKRLAQLHLAILGPTELIYA